MKNVLQGELHTAPAAELGKCHGVKGQAQSETEMREGGKQGLSLEGERAAAVPLPPSVSCRKNWGKELGSRAGGPQGGARGRVSSGQALHPDVPQFSPSC